jgi:hypothetical protein
MRNPGPQLFSFLLLAAAAIMLACGSSQHSQQTLQSVTLSPASADAQNYPNGQVQFTATGTFATMPSPVTPLPVTWNTCNVNGQPQISVSTTGVAQCNAGAVGTFVVEATGTQNLDGGQCLAIMACGSAGEDCEGIHTTAQLTCP